MDLQFQGQFQSRTEYFVEKEYEVRVALVDRDTSMVISRNEDLSCDLRTNPDVPSVSQVNALDIVQGSAKLKDGVAVFRVRMKMEACRSGMLYLVVSFVNDTIVARKAVSKRFDALRYKLFVNPFPQDPLVFIQRDTASVIKMDITLKNSENKIVTNCDVPLRCSVRKVYRTGEIEAVEDTDKFLTIKTKNLRLRSGKAEVHSRLKELSNSHGGCYFRICVHARTDQRSESTSGIGSGMSSDIRVASRKRKKKVDKVEEKEEDEEEEEVRPAKRAQKCPPCPVPKQIGQDALKCFQTDSSSALRNVTTWASFAVQTLDKIQFELCGYGIGTHGLPDGAFHVKRCPWCFAYCESTHQQKHRKDCALATMIRLYADVLHSTFFRFLFSSSSNMNNNNNRYRAHIPESSKVLSKKHDDIITTTSNLTLPAPPPMIKSESWTSQASRGGNDDDDDDTTDFTMTVRESPGHEAMNRIPIYRNESDLIHEEIGRGGGSLSGLEKPFTSTNVFD